MISTIMSDDDIDQKTKQYRLLDTESMFNLGWKPNKTVDLFRSSMINYREIDYMIDSLYKQVFNMNSNIQ